MKKLLFTTLLIVLSMTSMAQELNVTSFEKTNGIIAGNDRRMDYNDVPCALVKIQVVDDIEDVDWAVIGDIVDNGTEKWVYMENGSKKMKVIPRNHIPVEITFMDYGIESLESNRVYKLVLAEPAPVIIGRQRPEHPFALGIRGGVNFTEAGLDEKGIKMNTGFHLGLSADYRFTKSFGVSTALLFTMKGYKQSNLDVTDLTATASFLELPVMAAVHIQPSNNIRLQLMAGPYVAYGLGGKVKSDHPHTDLDFFNVYEKLEYGIQGGGGMLLANHCFISATYQYGVGDYKNRNIAISIGYNF